MNTRSLYTVFILSLFLYHHNHQQLKVWPPACSDSEATSSSWTPYNSVTNRLVGIFFPVVLQSFWTLAASHTGGFLNYLYIW
jgi:hypothetical protein